MLGVVEGCEGWEASSFITMDSIAMGGKIRPVQRGVSRW